MRTIFVAGTGTGVGKTVVTGLLLRRLRAQGLAVAPMKPVQTGAPRTEAGWLAPDLEVLLEAGGLSPTPAQRAAMAPYCFEHASSPHLAARLEGRRIDIKVILESCRTLASDLGRDGVLLEGAGGLLVPIHQTTTMLDLIQVLEARVVLVSANVLGTINHTLLSLRALAAASVPVAGVVMNAIDSNEDPEILADNPRTIAALGGVPVLGEIPRLSSLFRWQETDAIPLDISAILP
jgi:dethiobiotin synthase